MSLLLYFCFHAAFFTFPGVNAKDSDHVKPSVISSAAPLASSTPHAGPAAVAGAERSPASDGPSKASATSAASSTYNNTSKQAAPSNSSNSKSGGQSAGQQRHSASGQAVSSGKSSAPSAKRSSPVPSSGAVLQTTSNSNVEVAAATSK
jgi:hypothetical protein